MPSQYEKRKAKVKPAEVAVAAPEIIAAETIELQEGDEAHEVLTHFAYDIFLGEDNRTYMIATIRYCPLTKQAVVIEVKPISRNIGLSHDHQKRALSTLKDRN